MALFFLYYKLDISFFSYGASLAILMYESNGALIKILNKWHTLKHRKVTMSMSLIKDK